MANALAHVLWIGGGCGSGKTSIAAGSRTATTCARTSEHEPKAGTPDTFAFPFSCECGASGCEEQRTVTVADYQRLVERGELLRSHEAERVGA